MNEATPLKPATAASTTAQRRDYCSPKLRVLYLFAFGALLFALTELIFAAMASSLTLFVDAITTLVDVSTYALNIVAEISDRGCWRHVAILWSVVALVSVAVLTLALTEQDSQADVHAVPLLCFSIGLLIVYSLSASFIFVPSWWRALSCAERSAAEPDVETKAAAPAAAVSESGASSGWADVNFMSAVAHAGADAFSKVVNIAVAVVAVSVDGEVARRRDDNAGALASGGVALVAAVGLLVAYVLERVDTSKARGETTLPEATGSASGESGRIIG